METVFLTVIKDKIEVQVQKSVITINNNMISSTHKPVNQTKGRPTNTHKPLTVL